MGFKYISLFDTPEELREQRKELVEWFDVYYTRHEQKYRRQMSIGTVQESVHASNLLTELFKEGEVNRQKILEIDELLKDYENASDKK